MKILVTGAGGLLGSEFMDLGRSAGHEMVGAGRSALDVTDAQAVKSALIDGGFEWVVHCAAFTAVDAAESEPEAAFRVNEHGAETVAVAAAEVGARVVYVSTDYVFDGNSVRPYRVDDAPLPLSVYGKSKLAGERAVQRSLGGDGGREPDFLVVRTGWLYGSGGSNFVTTMLRLAREGRQLRVVEDQVGRPTWGRNVAGSTIRLMELGAVGLMHVADEGTASWLEFAREAIRLEGLEANVTGVSTAEWGAAAPRPASSILDLSRVAETLGTPMMLWQEALAKYLRELR